MDIQKEKLDYTAMLVAEDAITQDQCDTLKLSDGMHMLYSYQLPSATIDCINWGWSAWLKAKAQAVPEGFALVSKELPETIAEAMALERVPKPFGETDPVWIEISERSYRDNLLRKKWDLWRDYKAMIEAQEQSHD